TGEDGVVFKKFLDYEHDTERLKAQGAKAVVAEPPSAAELRAAAGMSFGSQAGKYDPGQIALGGDRKGFVKAYFMSRALEILAEKERRAQDLSETFAPAGPGQDGKSGSAVSPKAQALIDSSRKLLPAYEALLDAEAQLDRSRALVERGRQLGRTDIT